MKIVWKISPPPTGRFRSFERRAWPTAHFSDDQQSPAAMLSAPEEYCGKHRNMEILPFELVVRVLLRQDKLGEAPWRWVVLKKRARSIREAKELVETFYAKYPENAPKEAA